MEESRQTIRYFSVIDSIVMDKKTGELSIDFNEQYLKQLSESRMYALINFEEYKKIERPIAARLYEILIVNLKEQAVWIVNIFELAEKLTIEKKGYPSHILAALNPSIEEILVKTQLYFSFIYDKSDSSCIFRLK